MEQTKETFLKGKDTFLKGKDTFLKGKDTFLKGKNKIVDIGKNVMEMSETIVSKTMNLKAKDIGKKIFDNMIWVFVLVGVLILVYLSYILTQSFNIDSKIQLMNKEYNISRKVNLETPSESGNEEVFDEIKIDKHSLCDVFICSSSKSYLSGRQVFDYVSKEMFFENIKLGARYVELDLFEDKGNIVVSNGLLKGNWKLTLNSIFFEDFCRDIGTRVFNKDYTPNYDDPFILFLGLNLDKDKINYVAKIIKNTLEKYLIGSAFSINGKMNVLETPLKDLLGKIIIITDGKISNTEMLDCVHLRIGNKVRRMTYDTYLLHDKEKLKQFNKTGLSIVTPNPNLSSMNYNPEKVFDSGCQIISLNFQYVNEHMKAYLTKFQEKSFIIKPFEFTKFSDLPQRGYDPEKIAYYENYEILKGKKDSIDTSLSHDYNTDGDSIFFKNNMGYEKPNLKHGCCTIFASDDDVDKAYPKVLDTDTDTSITNTSINNMLIKLQELHIHPDENYNKLLENYSEMTIEEASQFKTMIGYGEIIIISPSQSEEPEIESLLPSPSPSQSSSQYKQIKTYNTSQLDLKYFILNKQLKKVFQDKREELFKAGMKDPCHGLDDKCSSNPMCYFKPYQLKDTSSSPGTSTELDAQYNPISKKCNDGRIIYKDESNNYVVINKNGTNFNKATTVTDINYEKLCSGTVVVDVSDYTNDETEFSLNTRCESSLSSIPYPKLCLPKYIAPNRNMCLTYNKDKNFIDSKGIRQIFHETMTRPGFSGKWNSYLGPIVIPNDFNNQCEFIFTTDFDSKIFTMFMVNSDGEYFNNTNNFIGEDNTYTLRAKGTFVDPALRNLEKENNLPEMPYHGYVEMKMGDSTNSNRDECRNNKFEGIYKYSDLVFDKSINDNVPIDLYTKLIGKIFENTYTGEGFVLGYNKKKDAEGNTNNYCYKVMSSDCIDTMGPAISFDRHEDNVPSYIYADAITESPYESNSNLIDKLKAMDFEFTEEELENDPKLKKRLIGMVSASSDSSEIEVYNYNNRQKSIKDFDEKQRAKLLAEKAMAAKKKAENENAQKKKEIAKKAELFIYTTNESSNIIKKPGDTIRISGVNDEPFCLQTKITDIEAGNCSDGKCGASVAYIADCKNSLGGEPYCGNIYASHNIEIVDDGSTGDDRVQTIRSLNSGTDNLVDACLSYNDNGDVLYGQCNTNKNEDESIKNKWRVSRLKDATNYNLKSIDGKCLTRVPYEDKEAGDLIDGLYEKNELLKQSFASTKMMECSDDKNQLFDIKYMGDVENCGNDKGYKAIDVANTLDTSYGADGGSAIMR